MAPPPLSAEQLRHQRRTALLGAALIVPFGLVDLAQGGPAFSLTIALAARAAWIVVLLGGVALLSRQPPRPRAAASLMAGGSCAALVVVVSATGGTQSGYFGFLLALPFCMLVLLPGQLAPAVTCGGVGIAAGALMLSGAGAPAVEIARWTGTGLAASALAAYATHVGGSLIQRMLQAASARAETLAALAESERRRAAAERLATIGRLAAGVAHEINNPLSLVKANIALIQEQLAARAPRGDGTDLESSLSDAALGVERIRRIVADLRGFARGEAAEPCGTAVDASANEALRLASLRMRGIALHASIPAELPPVRICRKRLVQVLVNLLVNAADAVDEATTSHQERSWIDVAAAQEGDEVVVRVADGGPGIPPAALEHLFEPFFTTKPLGIGTGIGLALSQEYVTAVGGRLTGSNAAGGGAVFEVRLPTKSGAPGCDTCAAASAASASAAART